MTNLFNQMMPRVPNKFNNQNKANHEIVLRILKPKVIAEHTLEYQVQNY